MVGGGAWCFMAVHGGAWRWEGKATLGTLSVEHLVSGFEAGCRCSQLATGSSYMPGMCMWLCCNWLDTGHKVHGHLQSFGHMVSQIVPLVTHHDTLMRAVALQSLHPTLLPSPCRHPEQLDVDIVTGWVGEGDDRKRGVGTARSQAPGVQRVRDQGHKGLCG